MKNLLLSFLLISSFSKNVEAQFIDALEVNLSEINIYSASSEIYFNEDDNNKTFLLSLAWDLKLGKLVYEDFYLQLGVRYRWMPYRLNFSAATIEDFFLKYRNEEIMQPVGMENLLLRRVRFKDQFISIPIGGKYFFSDRKDILGGFISGYYQPSILINHTTETEIATTTGTLFPFFNRVMNSEFEPLVDEYFNTRKSFYSNIQLGLGMTLNWSEKSLLLLEMQYSRIFDSLHESMLKNQNGFGVRFGFISFFSKKDKQKQPLE